jgi:hypothetical protein
MMSPRLTPLTVFMEKFPQIECPKLFLIREMIPGITVQLFYDDTIQNWEIATKTEIGAQGTVRSQFIKACQSNMDLSSIAFLPNLFKHFSYEFVITCDGLLYLVGVHCISKDTNTAYYVSPLDYALWEIWKTHHYVLFPLQRKETTYTDIILKHGSIHSHGGCLGTVITHLQTGESTEIINPNFLEKQNTFILDRLLFFHFLCFFRIGKVDDFVFYFPEHAKIYKEFNKHFSKMCDGIVQSYMDYYVFKKTKFVSKRYFYHIREWHTKHSKEKINRKKVESYLLQYDPHLLFKYFYSFD